MIVIWQDIPEDTRVFRCDVPEDLLAKILKGQSMYIGLEGADEDALMELSNLLSNVQDLATDNLVLIEQDEKMLICGMIM